MTFDYYDFMTRGFDDITLMFYETKPWHKSQAYKSLDTENKFCNPTPD